MSIRVRFESHMDSSAVIAVFLNGIPIRFADEEMPNSLDQLRWWLIELMRCSDRNIIEEEPQSLDELVRKLNAFNELSSVAAVDGATYRAASIGSNLVVCASRWENWGDIPEGAAQLQVMTCKIQDALEVIDEYGHFVNSVLVKLGLAKKVENGIVPNRE